MCSLMSVLDNIQLQGVENDYRIWLRDSSGIFSCQSFFKYIIDSMHYVVDDRWRFIWKEGIPSKVKFFVWVAFKRKLNTCYLLQKRRPSLYLSPQWCVLCKSNGDDIDYLFLHCPFSYFVWIKVLRAFQVQVVMPKSWKELLKIQWIQVGNEKRTKVL